uniref:C2H2-type domain-containing protein n=1 Tax=viral metagenome TaxID=1070528 RepID=A0A6C0BBI1_9ZZZZ
MIDTNDSETFNCETCNFTCSKKSNFLKHNSTRKHIVLSNNLQITSTSDFVCSCGRNYKHRQSLHKHKKLCNTLKPTNLINENATNNFEKLANLLLDVVKQNQELQKIISLSQK